MMILIECVQHVLSNIFFSIEQFFILFFRVLFNIIVEECCNDEKVSFVYNREKLASEI